MTLQPGKKHPMTRSLLQTLPTTVMPVASSKTGHSAVAEPQAGFLETTEVLSVTPSGL